jgi:hypothetical protein
MSYLNFGFTSSSISNCCSWHQGVQVPCVLEPRPLLQQFLLLAMRGDVQCTSIIKYPSHGSLIQLLYPSINPSKYYIFEFIVLAKKMNKKVLFIREYVSVWAVADLKGVCPALVHVYITYNDRDNVPMIFEFFVLNVYQGNQRE